MRSTILYGLVGSLLLAGTAYAQTAPSVGSTAATTGTTTPSTSLTGAATTTGASSATGTPSVVDPNAGAFDKLSPGSQTIARALYRQQTTQSGTKPLTLNQIAAMKTSGTGWGQVFHQMHAQGLTTEKNLGEAVSEYRHRQNERHHESQHAEHRDVDVERANDGHSHVARSRDRDDAAVTSGLGSTQSAGHSHGGNHRVREAANVSVTTGLGGVPGGGHATSGASTNGKAASSGSHQHGRD
jgi:hypothetical protein